MMIARVLLLSFIVCFIAKGSLAAHGLQYKDGDPVPVLVNKIGPYSNPSETYPYYSLPFCAPPRKQRQADRTFSLGELLEGDEFKASLFDIKYKQDVTRQKLCDTSFDDEQVKQFIDAIDKHFYFEIAIDDLPAHGFVGTLNDDGQYYLFHHVKFHITYHKDRIISVHASPDAKLHTFLPQSPGGVRRVSFSYSVLWEHTDEHIEQRGLVHSKFFRTEMEIHWLSVLNSFVLALLLSGFLVIILMRVLKSDYSRYNADDVDEEDYGWKLVHGDVFRFPPYKMTLAALLGNGAQMLCVCMAIILLAIIGVFYPGSYGSGYTAACVLYALTAVVSGFVSSKMYAHMGEKKWAWNLVGTSAIYAGPFVVVFTLVNVVAKYYGATSAVELYAIVIVLAMWLFVGFPLTVFGGIAGRRVGPSFEAPLRTKTFPREIPRTSWYRRPLVQISTAGLLPFSAIYIEIYYVYSAVWGRHEYSLYGILLIVFIILLVVTACVTVALTYFQLSSEDYRWWWHSFACGGSCGIFIYGYSIFYYFFRSNMFGALQAAFFFGYMLVICYLFFIMLGTVGFFSAFAFVRRIYRNIHVD